MSQFVIIGTSPASGDRYALTSLGGAVIRAMMGVNDQRWAKFDSRAEAETQIKLLGPGYLSYCVEEFR